jgi:type II secretory pathway pseudopilin PulG
MSLMEVMVVIAIMGVLLSAMMSLFSQQMKSNNFLEFQNKREQLRLAIMGQFLNTQQNCNCLFQGAAQFPIAGTPALSGFTPPTMIGRYTLPAPGVCGTIVSPFVDNVGIDGIQLSSVNLKNITNGVGGVYSGTLEVSIQSLKQVAGPSTIFLTIPVAVVTTPAGPGNVNFNGCAMGVQVATPPVNAVSAPISCGSAAALGTGTATCPAGKTAVSCGTFKNETSSEDVLMCQVNPATNACDGFRDLNGGCDPGAVVNCYCL